MAPHRSPRCGVSYYSQYGHLKHFNLFGHIATKGYPHVRSSAKRVLSNLKIFRKKYGRICEASKIRRNKMAWKKIQAGEACVRHLGSKARVTLETEWKTEQIEDEVIDIQHVPEGGWAYDSQVARPTTILRFRRAGSQWVHSAHTIEVWE